MLKKILNVIYDKTIVGQLLMADAYTAAFQYSKEWVHNGFSLSPFLLPLETKVFLGPDKAFFDGLHGVFSDSLPDGWGRLLVDRMLKKHGLVPDKLTPVERLAIVGRSGMGALCYEPEFKLTECSEQVDIDTLALACQRILAEQEVNNLDDLFLRGGSSGGARPKAFITLGKEAWLVKFPNSQDNRNIGKQEYDYAQCAAHCGLEMAPTKLFPSEIYPQGIFTTKRFDRIGEERIHMVSACGLLEASHRVPSLDYLDLVKVVYYLCHDIEEELKLFKYMCFNVFAHNRDDHSKNFSFLYDAKQGRWHLSPAYDLTYSNSLNGWHATTVNGNGENPGMEDILAVAKAAGIRKSAAEKVALQIKARVQEELGPYFI